MPVACLQLRNLKSHENIVISNTHLSKCTFNNMVQIHNVNHCFKIDVWSIKLMEPIMKEKSILFTLCNEAQKFFIVFTSLKYMYHNIS